MAVINGTAADHILIGTSGIDTLFGFGDDDALFGAGGAPSRVPAGMECTAKIASAVEVERSCVCQRSTLACANPMLIVP